jgi:hypothetical protein
MWGRKCGASCSSIGRQLLKRLKERFTARLPVRIIFKGVRNSLQARGLIGVGDDFAWKA